MDDCKLHAPAPAKACGRQATSGMARRAEPRSAGVKEGRTKAAPGEGVGLMMGNNAACGKQQPLQHHKGSGTWMVAHCPWGPIPGPGMVCSRCCWPTQQQPYLLLRPPQGKEHEYADSPSQAPWIKHRFPLTSPEFCHRQLFVIVVHVLLNYTDTRRVVVHLDKCLSAPTAAQGMRHDLVGLTPPDAACRCLTLPDAS